MLSNFSIIGLNHLSSSVDLREHISFGKDNLEEALKQFNDLPGIRSGFILSTCNRAELYYLGGANASEIIGWLADFHHLQQNKLSSIRGGFYHYRDKDALQHLIKVASGLDSMALGETQVFGQIKDIYKLGLDKNYVSKEMDSIMQLAFAIAKKVRTETDLGKNPATLAATAVKLAAKVMDGLKGKSAMVVGAGDNSRLVIKHLSAKGVGKIYLANRTYNKAAALAKECGGEALPLIDIAKLLPQVDCLFTSTSSPTILVGKGMVEDAVNKWGRKPMFISDMSLPHDVEDSVGDINQVYLYKLDDLETSLKENQALKQQAADQADEIIERELRAYINDKENSNEDLKLYYRTIEEFKRRELAKLIDDSTDAETKRKLIQLADGLAAKLSHGPGSMIKAIHQDDCSVALHHMRRNLFTGKKQEAK